MSNFSAMKVMRNMAAGAISLTAASCGNPSAPLQVSSGSFTASQPKMNVSFSHDFIDPLSGCEFARRINDVDDAQTQYLPNEYCPGGAPAVVPVVSPDAIAAKSAFLAAKKNLSDAVAAETAARAAQKDAAKGSMVCVPAKNGQCKATWVFANKDASVRKATNAAEKDAEAKLKTAQDEAEADADRLAAFADQPRPPQVVQAPPAQGPSTVVMSDNAFGAGMKFVGTVGGVAVGGLTGIAAIDGRLATRINTSGGSSSSNSAGGNATGGNATGGNATGGNSIATGGTSNAQGGAGGQGGQGGSSWSQSNSSSQSWSQSNAWSKSVGWKKKGCGCNLSM